jgi:hypothetical protein
MKGAPQKAERLRTRLTAKLKAVAVVAAGGVSSKRTTNV